MGRIGANRPLNQRVIFELGEDYQLEDEEDLGGGGGGGGFDPATNMQAVFSTVEWVGGDPQFGFNPIQWETVLGSDNLGLTAQLPTDQLVLPPGIYELFAWAAIGDMNDANTATLSLIYGTDGDNGSPAQTGRYQVGDIVAWDAIDVGATLFVGTDSTGFVLVVTGSDEGMGTAPEGGVGLYIRQMVAF